MKICKNCGKKNPDDYSFCMNCGRPIVLPAIATAVALGISSESTMDAVANREPLTRRTTSVDTLQEGFSTRHSTPLLTKCPLCAEEVLAEAKKCKHCGEFIGLSGSANAAFSGRVKELSTYYRKEFQEIRNSGEVYRGKWNWAAFFFGGFWALSKGLWKSGLVSLVGSLFTAGIVGIIYWFIFASRGNYMFYKTVVKRQEPWI